LFLDFLLRFRLTFLVTIIAWNFSFQSIMTAAEISFRHDVMAVLSKSGCNLGTCHGNARGKGGFQISLRGQDPTADFAVLTRDLYGRRSNANDPDQSLLLLKPSMQMAHEGGKRFSVDSYEYRLIRDWISSGMPDDRSDTRQLVSLRVTPDEVFLTDDATASKTRWQQQITATADFSDGSSRDVTSLAVYEVSQPIADVSHDGLVTGHSAGELTVIVRYLQQQIAVRIAFVPQRPHFVWSAPNPANFVDELVFSKLRKIKVNPSPVCDDATFIRRVTLDLLGLPPTADEARRFVSDPSAGKRSALINTLLERPEFAEWWAMKWSDLLRIEEKTLDRKGVENFHGWLRDAFATHKPLDRLVREVVAGRGSTYEVPPANFYRALRTPFERSEAIGQLFLGVRLQCSKCHNHPFDRWTQDDYYSWGSVFSRVDYKIIENRRRDSNDSHEFDGEQIVYLKDSGEAKDPRINKTRPAKFLGDNRGLESQQDPLTELAGWLTDPHNDRFAQMLANRTWQQVIGRGIVDPIDDFRATNPPSNPALLKAIANHLVGSTADAISSADPNENRFNLRSLLQVILNSRTYQLASSVDETNRDDETNFSHAFVRRHSAEQLLDATSQVLGVPLDFAGYPSGRRAGQLPGVPSNRERNNGQSEADRFLKLFGKPPRLQSCDCERSDETTLGQTFQLVSGSLINRMLTTSGNILDSLAASHKRPSEIVTELYWMAITRPPSQDELSATVEFLEKTKDRRQALEDIAWGLFNSNEFLLRR
jgi:Protein of unknown function (DUF1549)/Protein of unknown function (DUF1553)/Bacterial Ig-like domain (group 2)